MALSKDTMSKISAHLSAYRSACEEHPELKSFDSSLQQRTNKVIDSLTSGAENTLSSQNAVHKEVSQHLLEVNQDVAKFILESKDDMWESNALKHLVKAYFENTDRTLQIFRNVMGCVERTEISQYIILGTVAKFDKKSAEKDVGGNKKKYENTLKELKKLKTMGDPFDGHDLTTHVNLIIEQQKSLLEEVSEAKTKIDEEVKELAEENANLHKLNILFGATFCIVVIGSVALIASGVRAPAGVAGLVDAGLVVVAVSLPGIALGWGCVHSFLEKRRVDVKRHHQALARLNNRIKLVDIGTQTNKVAMETVSELVRNVEKSIWYILGKRYSAILRVDEYIEHTSQV